MTEQKNRRAVSAACGAFVLVSNEFERQLVATGFQRQPAALALYNGAVGRAAARALTRALAAAPRAVKEFLNETESRHWRMLKQQATLGVVPRSRDQVIVWLCRDALQRPLGAPPRCASAPLYRDRDLVPSRQQRGAKHVVAYDYFSALRAAAGVVGS